MVQECYTYVDAETDLSIKLRLIDTLRTVTAGKVSTSTVFTIALSVYQIYFLWARSLPCCKDQLYTLFMQLIFLDICGDWACQAE